MRNTAPFDRVIPRDFFNCSKLYKCLGQFVLNLETAGALGITVDDEDPDALDVWQDQDCGGLTCEFLKIELRGKPLYLRSIYNSKAPYPLVWDTCNFDNIGDIDVFNDDGTFADSFVQQIQIERDREP